MSCRLSLSWLSTTTPQSLHPLLRSLGAEYPICEGPREGTVSLLFDQDSTGASFQVRLADQVATIRYDKPHQAARAIGALLAGLVQPGVAFTECNPFKTFGIMLDCSRNAVMTVEYLHRWFRRLSLMGYNMVMLYTEQTYELPDEPYFGYMRGRYTAGELQQIDRNAAALGIELIGCIQTLGHLTNTLKWTCYNKVRDTSSVLLADEPQTYELIEKMIAAVASNVQSRRIHIGMDEAHDLGRGKFLDKNGYQSQFDIFNRHLAKVIDICRRHSLEPMLWSDMYFRMGSKTGDYYDRQSVIPPEVRDAIPSEARLVYWDYYHDDKQFYVDFIRRHVELGCQPVMASGIWTWRRQLWYDPAKTQMTVKPCLAACRQEKVDEVFFTLWGDDGTYCEYDSALAGLAWAAELAYSPDETVNEDTLSKRFEAICGIQYQAVMDLAAIDTGPSSVPGEPVLAGPLLWDDPLLGIYWKACTHDDKDFWQAQADYYAQLLERLARYAKITVPVDLAHGVTVGHLLHAKVRLKLELDAVYPARDKKGLRRIAKQVPVVVDLIDKTLASFRRQWYRRNKPFGFEVIQIRLAGQRERFCELGRRIDELLGGQVEAIPELDEVANAPGASKYTWQGVATGGSV